VEHHRNLSNDALSTMIVELRRPVLEAFVSPPPGDAPVTRNATSMRLAWGDRVRLCSPRTLPEVVIGVTSIHSVLFTKRAQTTTVFVVKLDNA